MRQPNGQSSMNNYLLRSGKSIKTVWPKSAPATTEEENSWARAIELMADVEGVINPYSSYIEKPLSTGLEADKQQKLHKRRSNSCPSLDLLQIQVQPARGQIQDAQQAQQAPNPDRIEYHKRNVTELRVQAGDHLDHLDSLELQSSTFNDLNEKTSTDVTKN
mgnify:CR=1 FL=1